jgi:hypothetical protein
MKTYEDKKKMAENFPEGTKCLIEFESVKDPKENPFKQVRKFKFNLIFNIIYLFRELLPK